MNTKYLIVVFLLLFNFSKAQPPSPALKQSQAQAITNATIHIGNGEVIENGTITFADGMITNVGKNIATNGMTVIDASNKHVYPSFILANSKIGLSEVEAVRSTNDFYETGVMNPEIRSLIAYNAETEVAPTYRFNGVLLAQVVPQGGTISGSSSVVQLDAWNWEDAAVKKDLALHLRWPSFFNNSTDPEQKEKALKQYIQSTEMIENIFREAYYVKDTFPKVNNQKLKAMQGLFDGTKKLFIHAYDEKSIMEALLLAKKYEVKKIVLVSKDALLNVLDYIKNNNIEVLVEGIHRISDKDDLSLDATYTLPSKLKALGIKFAICYEEDSHLAGGRNLPFFAGHIVPFGFTKEEALQTVSNNVALILGINDKYGTLEKGKSATLFISQGDALDMRTNILTDAFIDGRKITLNAKQQRLNEKYRTKYSLK